MINPIAANAGYMYPSSSSGAGTASSLAQTEEQLFADIDTNGDGSISQSELTSFMSQLRAAGSAGAATSTSAPSSTSATGVSALYGALDKSGGNGISLQDFESNIGSFAAALRSQLATAQSVTAGSAATTAATTAGSTSSAAAADSTGATRPHGHHGHHGGAQALAASLLQQLQSSGTTAAAGTQPTLDTTA
ncbi:MAG TPA: EF-hand domain-containing protein [Steroidobacteraceae bacterium]|jgi:hypothetical protein